MAFTIEPPDFNPPPPGAVKVSINLASRNEITVNVPLSHVDQMFENFTTGETFTITSVADPHTGKFDRVAINPNLVEYIQVKLEESKETAGVRAIYSGPRPFDPNGGGN